MQQKTPDRLSSRVFVILCVYCPSPRFFNHSVFHKVVISFLENFFKFFPRIAYPAWETQWISVRAVAMFVRLSPSSVITSHSLYSKMNAAPVKYFQQAFAFSEKLSGNASLTAVLSFDAVVHVDRLQTVHYVGVFIQKFH